MCLLSKIDACRAHSRSSALKKALCPAQTLEEPPVKGGRLHTVRQRLDVRKQLQGLCTVQDLQAVCLLSKMDACTARRARKL